MIEADQIIYLDNNATTRPDPAVVEEMVLYLEKLWGNPSSGYRFGKQVRAAVDLARQRVATLLGCETIGSCFHERRHGIKQHRDQCCIAHRSETAAHRHHFGRAQRGRALLRRCREIVGATSHSSA